MKKNAVTTMQMVAVILTIGLVSNSLSGLFLGYYHMVGHHEGKGWFHQLCVECPCMIHEDCQPIKEDIEFWFNTGK